MKIGLLADIHGNAPALRAVLPVLLDRVERVIFAGDLVGYYPFVNECVARWDQDRIVGVRGNHDEILLQCLQRGQGPGEAYRKQCGSALERTWQSLSADALRLLQSWPIERTLRLDAVSMSVCHGAPWDPLEARVYPDFTEWERFENSPADVIVLGHTHYPLVKRWKRKLIVNPGSVGQPRDHSEGAAYAELDLASGEVTHHRVAYDHTALVQDARRHDPSHPYLVEVLSR